MRMIVFVVLASVSLFGFNLALADSLSGYRDAQRIIVITEDEAIHYATFCLFYELRELLVESVGNVSAAVSMSEAPRFEIKVLSKSGEHTVFVGDHWIRTDDGAALLTSASYERIVESAERRRGEGQPKAKVNRSIQQILKRIRDPAYVEQNMCRNR
jgi:hypothetical protein